MTAKPPLDRYREGDADAFGEIVARFERPLLAFVRRLIDDPSLRHDIVQETFIRLARDAENVGKRGDLESWLYRVCRNLSIDVLKKEARMRRRECEAAVPEEEAQTPSPIEIKENRTLMNRLLNELPPNQKEVVFLKVVEGMSYKQISHITGHSSGHVGYLIHHGIKHLAKSAHAAGLIETMPEPRGR